MAEYDIQGAREAGVNDSDIAATLAPKMNYDLEGARKAGVPDKEIADALALKFNSTQGGAAVGNPSIMRQGDKALKGTRDYSDLEKLGGAGLLGGMLGAAGPEIMTGLGNAAGSFPATAPLRGPLMYTGAALRAAGRPAATAAGAVSGLAGEAAGQAVEVAGGGPTAAEAARIVGGGITPEFKTLAFYAAKRAAGSTGITDLLDAARKYIGKDAKLSVEQERYLQEQIAALRGGPKSDASLQSVGDVLQEAGDRGIADSTSRLAAARQQAEQVGKVAPFPLREHGDIGSDLRAVITGRNQAALSARAAAYKNVEAQRDALVAAREGKGDFVTGLPEYEAVIADIEKQLEPGRRSPSVQAGFQKMLTELENPNTTFQALDDVRRKLGEAFRGKPAEGYDAIGEAAAKSLYEKVSDIQKRYAGPAQVKLLDDYAAATEGLQGFRSKAGKKATALDTFDASQFDTDAATLPKSYFKSRASVQALKELTGDSGLVNRSALEYANKELQNATGPEVRAWMGKNSEWLKTLPEVMTSVERHAGRLEQSERALRNASTFAEEAAKTRDTLTRGAFPVQRVRDLVESGNADLWAKAGPAIAASTEGKANVLQAVRQVLADKAERSTKGIGDFFARNVRPALEQSNLADAAALDLIATKLSSVEKLKIPEEHKLSMGKRVVLQGIAGYTASGTARGAVEAAKMVPE